jgi:hypothetical protein
VKSWICHYLMCPDILTARTLVWGSGFLEAARGHLVGGIPELLTTVAAPGPGQTISGTRRCATANSKSDSSSTSACAS